MHKPILGSKNQSRRQSAGEWNAQWQHSALFNFRDDAIWRHLLYVHSSASVFVLLIRRIGDNSRRQFGRKSFEAPAPNRKWIADFTYVWTAEGWLYVAAVVDLFSRRVVGWSMSAAMTAQLVTDALVMALWRRGKPDALLHHSDRGSQYTSEQFLRLMTDHGVVCSMSRSGNVWDNAAMESFFSSLKTERTARKLYRTRDEAKADVFDYIERFYNPKRRHSTIGYLSPMEFERKVGLA
jgi:putative transposase